MKKSDFLKCWNAFLHWKGWRMFASFWVTLWKKAISWNGWNKIFGLPFLMILAMTVLCACVLTWIFLKGLEQTICAYFVYALSAYFLVALCVRLPSGIQYGKQWVSRHPRISTVMKNEELKFKLELYFEQMLNFGYGAYKINAGIFYGSAWIGCDGIYNMTQAFIQLFQILRRKNPGTIREQWKSYRFCGVMILIMHLTLTGIVFQMVNWNRAEDQGEIMVIATAAFAFFKFFSSFIDIAKDRKHIRPIDSSVRMLELSQAIFAIFSLQASMFHTFGTGEDWEHWMNFATGCIVCLLVASMGVYMIHRGNREIRNIQEIQNGTAKQEF